MLQLPMLQYSKEEVKKPIEKIVKRIYPETYLLSSEKCYELFIERLNNLLKSIEINNYIPVSVNKNELINTMCRDAMIHGCYNTNKKAFSKEEIEDIYNNILI